MKKAGFIFVAAALLLAGCAKDTSRIALEDSGVSIPLSLSVGPASVPETKMTDGIVQKSSSSSFRGIKMLLVLPFRTSGGEVAADDHRWAQNLGLPQIGIPANTFGDDANEGEYDGLVRNNNSHLFDKVFLRVFTNRVLVYGEALDESVEVSPSDSVDFKRRNGVLRPEKNLPYVDYPSEISFALEPMLSPVSRKDAFNGWKSKIIEYLNTITGSTREYSGKKFIFRDPSTYNNNPELVRILNEFTNEGRMIPCSEDYLSKKLTQLYRNLEPLASDRHNSMGYNVGTYYYVYELANQIRSKIQNSNFVTGSGQGASAVITMKTDGPYIYGLPYGSAPIQWREGTLAFGVLDANVGLAMPDVTSYCYPPSLWYYVNSQVITTDDESVNTEYKSTASWNDITSHYTSAGVKSTSKSAAVKDKLQYAVAMLTLKSNGANYSSLSDAKGTAISINNTRNFPLSGIIIGGQKKVDFEFTPTGSDAYYVYDADVYSYDAQNKASAKLYLTNNVNFSSSVSSLMLESEPGKEVNFALEFKNNSNSTIYGRENCQIYPGTHFYLLGKMTLASAVNNTGEDLDRVFSKDHETVLSVRFSGFENAFNVLPSLEDPQLQIGVEAQVSWEFATPGIVPVK